MTTISTAIATAYIRRLRIALALALALVALAAFAAFALPVARAGAQVPTSATFYGFIAPDERGLLPIKVRALGATPTGGEPTVCGTADVLPSGDAAGFYLLTVASDATRSGCPAPGGDVRFLLLHGAVDPGVTARQLGTWSAVAQRLDLSPVAESVTVGGFEGTFPSGSGYALLRWNGPDRTPVEQAIVTIPREVQVVFLLGTRTVQRYVRNAPAFVNDLRSLRTGDFVAVYVR